MSNAAIWTKEKRKLVRAICPPDLTDEEFEAFMHQVERTGLDPLARQIYCSSRWNKNQGRKVMVVQTPIDGFRLIAERTGKYAGQIGPFWCGSDGDWRDVWLGSAPPEAARVGVARNDFKEPLYAVARFSSYSQSGSDGRLNQFWSKMPDLMIAKCAEALALRRAFPQELSGIYSADEIPESDHSESDESPKNEAAPPKPVPPPARSAAEAKKIMHSLAKRLEEAGKSSVADKAREIFSANKTPAGAEDAIALMETALQLIGEAVNE